LYRESFIRVCKSKRLAGKWSVGKSLEDITHIGFRATKTTERGMRMFKFIDLVSKVTVSTETENLGPAQTQVIKKIANRK
jgi:hypothetical protein